MAAMRAAGVQLDRKVLADMAVRDPKVFRQYVEQLKDGAFTQQAERS
jgi:ribosomal protein L20